MARGSSDSGGLKALATLLLFPAEWWMSAGCHYPCNVGHCADAHSTMAIHNTRHAVASSRHGKCRVCPKSTSGVNSTSHPLLRHELCRLAAAALAHNHAEVQVHLCAHRAAAVVSAIDAILPSMHMLPAVPRPRKRRMAGDDASAVLRQSTARLYERENTWQPSARLTDCRARMPTSPITLPLLPTRMPRTCRSRGSLLRADRCLTS
jgi:hypothetical protein